MPTKKLTPKKKPVVASRKKGPGARQPIKKSERLRRSLLPGVLPMVDTTIPPPAPKRVPIRRLKWTSLPAADTPEFKTTLDPKLFSETRSNDHTILLAAHMPADLYDALRRFAPNRSGLSNFINAGIATHLRGVLDDVLVATLEGKKSPTHKVGVSIDLVLASRLKAAVLVLKGQGFTKVTIASLAVGCAVLRAKELHLR